MCHAQSETYDNDDDYDGPSIYVYDCARYLAELSVSVPALCLVYRPSVVSYASILYAIDSLDNRRDDAAAAASNGSERSSSLGGRLSTTTTTTTTTPREEYEMRVRRATLGHFDNERRNVEGATRILRAICPDLGVLFHLPPTSSSSMMRTTMTTATTDEEPMSPTSVML